MDWLLETDTGTSTTYEKFLKRLMQQRWAVRRTKKPKMLATEKLYPEKENYVFSRQMQTDLTDAVVVDQDPVAFITIEKEKRFGWLAVESYCTLYWKQI